MKALRGSLAVLLLVTATAVQAKDQKPADTPKNGTVELKKGLDAMIAIASPPGQANRPADPDQGDDNASDRAIQVVCSKGTPAAQRSAICPVPVSP